MMCQRPNYIYPHRSVEWCDSHEESPVCVPCGKCIACLVNKRNDWSFRLEQEYKYSNSAMFVTLTYDPKHLPSDGFLDKRHVQLFLKRLRKKDATNKIRYYAVGEYGSKFGRPHYHVLLFNAKESHVRSSWLDSNAQCIGTVHVGQVTASSVAYVTKYIVQPEELEAHEHDWVKPFSLMSRAYGIGGRYLDDRMVQWHRDNDAVYAIRDGSKVRLPRFYRDKIWYGSERERVSTLGVERSVTQQLAAEAYYRSKYGDRWSLYQHEAQKRVVDFVKVKVSYSQTF